MFLSSASSDGLPVTAAEFQAVAAQRLAGWSPPHPGGLLPFALSSAFECVSENIGMIADELLVLARNSTKRMPRVNSAHAGEQLVAASRGSFVGLADLEGDALFVNEAGRKLVGLPDFRRLSVQRS